MWKRARQRHGDRGVALVEFALILPLLMMLIFGIVQFGTLFNRRQAVHAAAREGARVASLQSTTLADIDARISDALIGVSFATTPTVTVTPNVNKPCEGRRGETVLVVVSVPMNVEIPMLGSHLVNVNGRGEFRCEG